MTKEREKKGWSDRPRDLALLALESLGHYVYDDMPEPGDSMHKDIAQRLARVADKNEW
jgi:hypothetical protein